MLLNNPNENRRRCEICGSPSHIALYEQRFTTFDGDDGLLTGYDVVACRSCGFVYADNLPNPLVFEQYYRKMSKHEPDVDDNHSTARYRQHNTQLVAGPLQERFPNRGLRILDVGVGNGDLLLKLRENGYTDLTGLDPSPRTADVLSKRELRILNMPVSDLLESTERFDLIVLSGVLEHLRDLRETLWLLRLLLLPSGRLCVCVPNASRFEDSVESPYQYFSVEHINFFTARSLESLFLSVGMQIESSWYSTALLGAFHEPLVHAVFKRTSNPSDALSDVEGPREVTRYIDRSRDSQDRLKVRLRTLIGDKEDVIVWGAGSLTMHLLSDPDFACLGIVVFVDTNAHYWGKTIKGLPVVSPLSVAHYHEPIFVVSYSYEDEICSQIRSLYNLPNKIIRLFGRSSPPASTFTATWIETA